MEIKHNYNHLHKRGKTSKLLTKIIAEEVSSNGMREEQHRFRAIDIILDMNSINSTYVRINNEPSSKIALSIVIRQGSGLSPILFNVIMDKVIKR